MSRPRPANPHPPAESLSNSKSNQALAHHRQRRRQVLSPPPTSDLQEPGKGDDYEDEDQEDSGVDEEMSNTHARLPKRGPDALRDALEHEAERKKRKRGCIKYVLKTHSLSTYMYC